MRSFLRRLKAAAVNAVFWGATWFGIGVALRGAVALLSGEALTIGLLLSTGLFTGAIGTFVGGLFSTIVAIAYRRHRIDELRTSGFTMLGVLAALVAYPVVASVLAGGVYLPPSTLEALAYASGAGMSGIIGAFTAFSTIRLAQQDIDRDRIVGTDEPRQLGTSSI